MSLEVLLIPDTRTDCSSDGILSSILRLILVLNCVDLYRETQAFNFLVNIAAVFLLIISIIFNTIRSDNAIQ